METVVRLLPATLSIDRSQFIHGIPESDASRAFLKADLPGCAGEQSFERVAALLGRRGDPDGAHHYRRLDQRAVESRAWIWTRPRETGIALHDDDLRV